MKKFLKITAIVLLSLLLILLILPFAFQKRIGELVKNEINKSVNSRVDYGKVSASFFRHFPSFTLSIHDLSLSGKEDFEAQNLFLAQSLSVTINLKSLLRGSPYTIDRILIKQARLDLLVLPDGKANWDIALPDTAEQTQPSGVDADPIVLKLSKISITNSDITYDDRSLAFVAVLNNVNGSLSGDMSLDKALLKLQMKVQNLKTSYEGMPLLDGVQANVEGELDAGLATNVYTIRTNVLKINELALGFEGMFDISGENIGMDFAVEAKEGHFKDLLSIVPVIYQNDFQSLRADGTFNLKAGMKGEYGEAVFPAYFAELNVNNGAFSYPSLPSKLEQFFIDTKIDNPTGQDNDLTLDISRLAFVLNRQPIRGQLNLRQPLTNPAFRASLEGRLDFEALSGLLPKGTIPEMKGIMNAAFTAAATRSDLENRRYQQVEAEGKIGLENFALAELKPGISLSIPNAEALLRPESSRLEISNMQLGSSDFTLIGQVADYLPYLFSDGQMRGNLSLRSSLIDANELMRTFTISDTAVQQADTNSFKLDLPKRLNLGFDATILRLIYEKYELTDVKAGLQYADQRIVFNPLEANMLGGRILMQGSFDGSLPESPAVDINFALKDFDIPQAYQTIGMFSRAAPVAEKTKGRFSTNFRLKGQLDQNLNPVFQSLQGGGGLQSTRITIESVNLLNTMAERLGNEELRRIVTDGINMTFEFVNGRVFQKPFTFGHADIEATMAGSIGFDQTLDYEMVLSIPFEKLGAEANRQLQQVSALAAGRGIQLASGTKINVKAKIGGTASAPTVSLDFRDYAANLRNQLMQAAAAEIEKQKEQLRSQMREEANKLIEDARKQGELLMQQAEATAARVRAEAAESAARVRREADVQAERLINDAKGKGMLAEMGAQEAARRLRQQAAAAATKIEQEADKQASNLIIEARKQSDKLLDDARAKASQL